MVFAAATAFYLSAVTVSMLFVTRSRHVAAARERFVALDALSPTTAADAAEAVDMGVSEADLRACCTTGVIQTNESRRFYWNERAYRAYRWRLMAIHALFAVAMAWVGAFVILAVS